MFTIKILAKISTPNLSEDYKCYKHFFTWALPSLFFYFHLFNTADIKCSIKAFADDWIRTFLPTEPQPLPVINVFLNYIELKYLVSVSYFIKETY